MHFLPQKDYGKQIPEEAMLEKNYLFQYKKYL